MQTGKRCELEGGVARKKVFRLLISPYVSDHYQFSIGLKMEITKDKCHYLRSMSRGRNDRDYRNLFFTTKRLSISIVPSYLTLKTLCRICLY